MSVSKPNSSSVRRILSTISLTVRLTPLSQLAPLLLDSEVFQHILIALEDDKASGLILAAYLEILARIALADANGFLLMIAEAEKRQHTPTDKLLEECLDAVWRNFDYVGDTRMRKAVGMAAGRLLTTVSARSDRLSLADVALQGQPKVLERLDGEFSAFSSSLDSFHS